MFEAAPPAEDTSTCPLLQRLVKAARLAHLSCGPPFYWWPLRPGFPERWRRWFSETVASHADCLCALKVFETSDGVCKETLELATQTSTSNERSCGSSCSCGQTGDASKRVTCARTATLATVSRAGPLFVVLPARRPLPWWQAHTR